MNSLEKNFSNLKFVPNEKSLYIYTINKSQPQCIIKENSVDRHWEKLETRK